VCSSEPNQSFCSAATQTPKPARLTPPPCGFSVLNRCRSFARSPEIIAGNPCRNGCLPTVPTEALRRLWVESRPWVAAAGSTPVRRFQTFRPRVILRSCRRRWVRSKLAVLSVGCPRSKGDLRTLESRASCRARAQCEERSGGAKTSYSSGSVLATLQWKRGRRPIWRVSETDHSCRRLRSPSRLRPGVR
jgi:hypothetical protein